MKIPEMGHCYFLGRWFPWFPWANQVYSNYWSYCCFEALKLKFRSISSKHSVFQFQALEKAQMKTQSVSQDSCCWCLCSGVRGPDMKCKLGKNHGLLGSPDRGCGLTVDSDTELCSATTLTAKCKDWGPEDCYQLSFPRNSCGKGCPCDFV